MDLADRAVNHGELKVGIIRYHIEYTCERVSQNPAAKPFKHRIGFAKLFR